MLVKVKGLGRYKKYLKKTFREFLYKGLSTSKRIEYWSTIAKLRRNKEVYKLKYARYVKKSSKDEADIKMDIKRTYPEFGHFKTGSKGYNELFNILKAVSHESKEVGYCQGMNFFSAVVLLILGNEEVRELSERVGCILDGVIFA